jgi:hypothetical protein
MTPNQRAEKVTLLVDETEKEQNTKTLDGYLDDSLVFRRVDHPRNFGRCGGPQPT